MQPFVDSGRTEVTDQEFTSDLQSVAFDKYLFRRVSAKDRTYNRVSFKYTIFENCYFRSCKFLNCDFTGAMFVDTNFHGSSFDGSRFDYCRFTRTLISHAVLDRHLPGWENVQQELTRNLRVNFGSVGDTEGVNKAISAELRATRIHFHKAAWSHESYFRDKYTGLSRLRMIGRHSVFVVWDFIWGNGESLPRVARTLVIAFCLIAAGAYWSGVSGREAFAFALPVFFGVTPTGLQLPTWLLTLAAAARLVLLGLFMSILIKRLARR
jgi:hypothetical protein